MKIMFVCSNSDLAGAPRHVALLHNHLAKEHEVYSIFGGDGEIGSQISGGNVEIISVLGSEINPARDFVSLYRLYVSISKFKPNVIHVHSFKAGLLVRLLSLFSSLNIIYTVHGWPWRGKGAIIGSVAYLFELFFALVKRSVQYIFVDPVSYKHNFSTRFIRNKSLVINGVEDLLLPPSPNITQNGSPSFIFVSRAASGKRHDLCVEGFGKYKARGGRGMLFFAGDGTLDELFKSEMYARCEGFEDYLVFLGSIKDLTDLYIEYDVVVLVSDFEAMPLCLIEGMSFGLAQIGSDTGGVYEIIDATTGALLQDNDPESIANAFEVFDCEGKLSLMKKNSRQKFLTRFAVQNMIKSIEKVYKTFN